MSSLIRRITVRAMKQAKVEKISVGVDSEGDTIFAWPLLLPKVEQPAHPKHKRVQRTALWDLNTRRFGVVKPRVATPASVKPKREKKLKATAGPVGEPRPKYHGQYVGMTGNYPTHKHTREIARRQKQAIHNELNQVKGLEHAPGLKRQLVG